VIRKYPSPVSGHVRVVFELPSSIWADRIYLTGDFNNWCEHDIRLQQTRNAVWQATVDLPMGRHYEFRYLIDGQWHTDFHADGYAENILGSSNSVVVAELNESELVVENTGLMQESHQLPRFTVLAAPARQTAKVLTHVAA
jgi:1,4-alpha-glucan branching enzyme